MSLNKKIEDFPNNPTPDDSALFLLEDIDGEYYKITKLDLEALLGGDFVKKGSITNNKILKGSSTDTATDSSISDDGTTVTVNSDFLVKSPTDKTRITTSDSSISASYDDGLTSSFVSVDDQKATMGASDGIDGGNIRAKITENLLIHSIKNSLSAPINEVSQDPTTLLGIVTKQMLDATSTGVNTGDETNATIAAIILASTTTAPDTTQYVPAIDDLGNVVKMKWVDIQSYLRTTYFNAVYAPIKTKLEDPFTISGTTVTLSHAPSFAFGYYMDGQRLRVGGGGRIVSVVGTLVTFDADYTGSLFDAVYEY